MAKDFWIDYSDPPYPAIRHRKYPGFDGEFNEVLTLPEARKRIKDHCRTERQHWLAVMQHNVALTPEQIIRDALDAGKTE